MIGLQSCSKISFVALPAIGVLQLVVAVHMTGLAGLRRMRALQREFRASMIEGRWTPPIHRMTAQTISAKSASTVVRISGRFEIGIMAHGALC